MSASSGVEKRPCASDFHSIGTGDSPWDMPPMRRSILNSPATIRWSKPAKRAALLALNSTTPAWRTVDLPHDWAIELPLVPKDDKEHGEHGLPLRRPRSPRIQRRLVSANIRQSPSPTWAGESASNSTACFATASSGSTATAWAATPAAIRLSLRPHRLPQLRRKKRHRPPRRRQPVRRLVVRRRGDLSPCLAGQNQSAASSRRRERLSPAKSPKAVPM